MITLGSSLSDVLGTFSICSWLFAQIPQFYKNMQNKSCEGLAITFLANWLFGDSANLIGCLLTDQLPFQTILATYFVLVDFGLFSQYFYYDWKTPSPPHSTRHHRYRTSSAASYHTHSTSTRQHASVHSHEVVDILDEDLDAVDENALSALSDSLQSESSRSKRLTWSLERGSTSRRSTTSQSTLSPTVTRAPSHSEGVGSSGRGRPRARESIGTEHGTDTGEQETTTSVRQASRASQRGASIVFLSFWALYGLTAMNSRAPNSLVRSTGRIIGGFPLLMMTTDRTSAIVQPAQLSLPEAESVVSISKLRVRGSERNETDMSRKRIIGRIFAWICTTSYLTSRLPQIYKNYARKSVEGLSMFLFVSAFLGNVFYVASILTAPQMHLPSTETRAYLRESMPFLLGSGGTLMFDFTIVTQSFIYKPKRRRRSSRRNLVIDEETARLLDDAHS